MLAAQYLRDLSRENAAPVVLRGAIGVLEAPPPLPERGVHALLALPAVDGDAWEAVLDRAPAAGSAIAGATSDSGYLPRVRRCAPSRSSPAAGA